MEEFKRRNETREQMVRLNGLASQIGRRNLYFKTVVTYRGGCFYLVARRSGQNEGLASFTDSDELQNVLICLSSVAPMPPDQMLKEKGKLWDEQLAYSEKRKALVADARKMDFPDAALEQQKIMEQAWAMRAREILCAKGRNWLDLYGILPQDAGIRDFEQHNPDGANPEDPVPCADFDWLSGEFRCHAIANFFAVYERAGQWPTQNFLAELRRFHTDNIRLAWNRLVEAEILPMMDKIKAEQAYTAPWRELVLQAKALVAPWSIARPWPMNKKARKKQQKGIKGIKRVSPFRRRNDQAATA